MISEALQRPLGPLQAWQWGVVLGGGYLGYRVLTGKGLFPGGGGSGSGSVVGATSGGAAVGDPGFTQGATGPAGPPGPIGTPTPIGGSCGPRPGRANKMGFQFVCINGGWAEIPIPGFVMPPTVKPKPIGKVVVPPRPKTAPTGSASGYPTMRPPSTTSANQKKIIAPNIVPAVTTPHLSPVAANDARHMPTSTLIIPAQSRLKGSKASTKVLKPKPPPQYVARNKAVAS